MRGAFDDSGTPDDFTDDKPRGTPLPCRCARAPRRRRSGPARWSIDCVDGERPAASRGPDDVPAWLASGAPSLQRRRALGSVYHQGRGAGGAGRARIRLDAGHRLQPRGRADRVRQAPDRDRRARRRRRCRRARPARPASTTRPATAACTSTGSTELQHDDAGDAGGGVRGLRARRPRARRRSSGRRSAPGRRLVLHGARVPADPRPEPDLHGLVLAGHAGGRLRRAAGRTRRASRRPATSSPTNANTWVSHVFKYAGEPGRHVHLLGRDRRLQPRRERAAARSTSTR